MALNPELLQKIRKVKPYVPGEQPQGKVIKLNTNENPYPPAPGVQKILQGVDAGRLRLYPDPSSDILVSALASYHGLSKDQVFVGVGSDEVLALSFLTFFHSEKPILFPDITYSFYEVWADLFGIPFACPGLDGDFRIRREDYYGENGGVVFPNPNAPTALYEDHGFLEDILEHNRDAVVIVDEAYVDFAGEGASAMPLLKRYDNLLVVGTFSKSRSLAGMRIGFAAGNPELIRCLNDVKYSFNSYTMNLLSLLCGTESVREEAYFRKTVDTIVQTREWAKQEFADLGFEFTDSRTNFLFVTHPRYDAGTLFRALKAHGIYVRHWEKARISRYLRVTVGTREEMEAFFAFLREYMKKHDKGEQE